MDESVVYFCDVTGASPEEAKNYLEIANNDINTAVTLYMESGGQKTAPASSSRPDSIHSDNDNMMTDEEIARQIQEREQEVRAPIAPKTDILAGGSSSDLYHSSPIWPRRDHVGLSHPSVFNQGDSATGSVTDFLNRLQSDVPSRSSGSSPDNLGSPASAKARRLADLFRPPFDIMYRGSFEEAREAAKDKSKWLMINVQDPTEFSCQVLNRDLWSDSFVKDIIKESFVFLQYSNSSADGTRYTTFYSINAYPHIAIIDARTGERVKVWEKQLSPTDFMMEVTEFLEQNSTDATRSAAIPKRPKKAKNVSDMSEEEQLNAAIMASLGGQNEDTSISTPDLSDMNIEPKQSKGKEKATDNDLVKEQPQHEEDEKQQDEDEEDMKAGSAFDGIKAVKRDETTDMANSTRIQLRMGDGSRIIRRFLKTDPVRYLFEFVKAEVPDAKDQQFELVFNRTQLIDVLDQTILEAGLVNAAVNCVIV